MLITTQGRLSGSTSWATRATAPVSMTCRLLLPQRLRLLPPTCWTFLLLLRSWLLCLLHLDLLIQLLVLSALCLRQPRHLSTWSLRTEPMKMPPATYRPGTGLHPASIEAMDDDLPLPAAQPPAHAPCGSAS